MSSLAELPELVGFFSYSREDDEDAHGALSALRERIQRELRSQLGRSRNSFRIWQDKEAIASGKLWKAEITTAIGQSAFFIPIITPTVVVEQVLPVRAGVISSPRNGTRPKRPHLPHFVHQGAGTGRRRSARW